MPTKIGKYTIVDKVGEGAMGAVYKAHDPALHRYVAIKTIIQSHDTDPEHRKRFLREARSAAQLIHPNIVTILDFGEDEGRFYMAMELLEGTDLKNLIRQGVPLSLSEKLRIMEQTSEGVGHAHAKGIVHRDLKPGNIHVQPSGQVKIMDFGLARLASSDMTKTGLIMGTPNYMSPEQVQAKPVDSRSDVFSLGAVFYELLTNHKPFDADSVHAILYKVAQSERAPITKWAPKLPQAVVRILDKALSKDPDERYENAYELLRALREVRKTLGSALEADDIWSSDLIETMVERPTRRGETAVKVSQKSAPSSSSDQGVRSRGTLRSSQLGPSRRWTLYAAAALGVVALGGLGVLFVSSAWQTGAVQERAVDPATPPEPAQHPAGIELAIQSLEAKKYQEALAVAAAILEAEPNHGEAIRVRDEARRSLDRLEQSLRKASALIDAGQSTEAAQALSVALTLDPTHPKVTELSNRLSAHFKSQAEEARRNVGRSREAALGAGAGSLPAFRQASQLFDQGSEALGREQYSLAAQKFLTAKDLFDGARRERQEEEARRARAEAEARSEWQRTAERWRESQGAALSESLETQPAYQAALSIAAEAGQLGNDGDYAESVRLYQLAEARLSEAKDQALRERRARRAEAAAAQSTPAPTTVPPQPATSSIPQETLDRNAIREVIGTWERAIESQDLALYRSVKPNLSSEDESRLVASFKAVGSHQVDISIVSVDLVGNSASVRIARSDTIVGNGRRHSSQFEQTLVLSKESDVWAIVDIRGQ